MAKIPGNWDFCGWASVNDKLADDGLIVRKGTFSQDNGKVVPLVWMHQHNDPTKVLGKVLLEERPEGMYAYGYFNDGEMARAAKENLNHGDVMSMSIWANNIVCNKKDVVRGVIREVSLVLSGSDPGAIIESVISRGNVMDPEVEDEAYIYTGEGLTLGSIIERSSTNNEEDDSMYDEYDVDNYDEEYEDDEYYEDDDYDEYDDDEYYDDDEVISRASSDDKTVGDVLDTLTDEQKIAVAALIQNMAGEEEADDDEDEADDEDEEETDEDDEESDDEEETTVKRSIFDNEENNVEYLSRSAQAEILKEAEQMGSFKKALKAHFDDAGYLSRGAIDTTGMITPSEATASQTYGFRDPDMLFPDYRALNATPEFITRDMGWVNVVLSGVHHSPFARIKSVFADITEEEARAKGYIKGKEKADEVFTLLKRTTDPQTIYKKQSVDRDDIIDITDFDTVAWIRAEMRMMLNEEIARAILIGDGRPSASNDKIKEDHIRPIAGEDPLFNIKVAVEFDADASDDVNTKKIINTIIKSRKDYKGSGTPTFFTTEEYLTDMLLLEDGIGHKLYRSEAEVATAIRAGQIVVVEAMEGAKVAVEGAQKDLIGIAVNLADYNVGIDKGGEINMFDDFDIDYNRYKYLLETRMSGALVKPFSAITIYKA